MTVKFFAQIAAHTRCDEIEIPLTHAIGADELWTLLEAPFPGILRYRSSTRLAANFIYAEADHLFGEKDEVALIPPVSGG